MRRCTIMFLSWFSYWKQSGFDMLEDDELSILFFWYIYTSDSAVHALQFLDVINMKDPGQKSQFYRTTLKDILPSIPKVK